METRGDWDQGREFLSLEGWVNEYFCHMFTRPIGQNRWCAKWWAHAEALLRLRLLWESWEKSLYGTVEEQLAWLTDFLEPHVASLMSSSGPFAQCSPTRHEPLQPLPSEPAPGDYWDEEEGGYGTPQQEHQAAASL